MDKAPSSRPQRAAIHIDLDGAEHIFRQHGWTWNQSTDTVFRTGMENALGFFRECDIRATMFVIAEDLEQTDKRDLIQAAVADGHEIASHSYSHANLRELSRSGKAKEIADSKRLLEDTLGVPVKGFRAPNYSIDRESLEIIADTGYVFDSSAFSDREFARRLRVEFVLPVPHTPLIGRPIVELPLPTHRPAPFPFHPSYSLLLGQQYFKWGLDRFQRTFHPLVFLFHLVDFAEPVRDLGALDLRQRIFTLSHLSANEKRRRCRAMLDRVKERFQIVTTQELIENSTADRRHRLTLGISTTHETAAALFDETGTCLGALSEERIDRVKFSTKYPPTGAIDTLLSMPEVDVKDITDVVIGGLPPGRLARKAFKSQMRDTFDFHGWNDYFPHFNKVLYRIFSFRRSLGYRRVLGYLKKRYGIEPRLHFMPHHLCHAASAYRTSPWDHALVVTADGVGDESTLTIYEGRDGKLQLLHELLYPHSFGQFYTACTQLLGFRANRHEGKITGLSGFGKVDPELYEKVKSTIRQSGPEFKLDKRYYSEGIIRGYSWKKIRKGEDLFDALKYRNYKTPLVSLLNGYSREDVAAVFQTLLEEEMIKVIKPFAESSDAKNLCLAGGVFANVKLNTHVTREFGFENVFVFPNMGDGGLSAGAALEFLQCQPRPFNSVYWGPDFAVEEMESALRQAADQGLEFRREDDVETAVAQLLTQKQVVARFDGRMEFGPRALGNRSILYSAADPDSNDWLNKRLGRTEFMPFAPIAMTDRADELFEGLEGMMHACKFMTVICDCTDFTKEKCPAVVHVDGTARPQLVDAEINPSMYRILQKYDQLTGVPLIVNTSFNMHEEPIVCTPQDAVRAFLASRLDYLAIGPFVAWLSG